MKLATISCSIPSIKYSNEEACEYWLDKITGLSSSEKIVYRKIVHKMLDFAGAKYRYGRDESKGETAYEHIMAAMKNAMVEGNYNAEDIDLVIYCGVGKGLIEPSNSYYYAKEMGILNAECFDVVDACMSWTRAMHICQKFLSSSAYKRIMVVTGEFHRGIRDTHNVPNVASLKYNFPMYTIGEAATATILEPSEDQWEFNFVSKPEHAELCTIPIDGYETFLAPSKRIGLNGPGKFVSFGKDLIDAATPLLTQLFQDTLTDVNDAKLYIPHAPSKTVYVDNLLKNGVEKERIFADVFEEYGNLVSSSVPTGIRKAADRGLIERGDSIVLVPASAGLSAAVVKLKY